MPEVVGAFGGRELFEHLADAMPDGGDGSLTGLAQQRLELGEHHLDGVQVWAVWRQEQQVRTSLADGAANRRAFVAAQIVENHDIARLQRGHKELLYPGKEGDGVDGAVQHAGCLNAIRAQGRQEGHGFPVTMRHPRYQALAFRGTAMGSGHVGLGPCLIHEHQACRVDAVLVATPAVALAGHVGPLLLGGVQAFF